jgi:hypothetical protein
LIENQISFTMKKRMILIFVMMGILFINVNLIAQDPPPPPPEGHGQTGNQPPGGGAPIGSGLAIMLALGAAYGGKKLHNTRTNKPAE